MRITWTVASLAFLTAIAGCSEERAGEPSGVAPSLSSGAAARGEVLGAIGVVDANEGWLVLLRRASAPTVSRGERRRALVAAEASIRGEFPQLEVTRGVERTGTGAAAAVTFEVPFLMLEATSDQVLLRRLREHPAVLAVVRDAPIRAELAALPPTWAHTGTAITGQGRAWGIDSVRAPSQWLQGWLGDSVSIALLDDGADLYGTGGSSDDHPDFDFAWSFSNNVYGLQANICPDGPTVPFGCYWEGTIQSHGSSTLGLFAGADDDDAAVGTAPAQSGSVYVHVPTYECDDGICVNLSVHISTIAAINAIAGVRVALLEVILAAGSLSGPALQTIRDEFIDAQADDQVLWVVPVRNEQVTDVGYPALWDEVLAVAAVGRSGGALVKPSWTPTNSAIDLVAPGEDQLTSVNRRIGVNVLERSGSSFAAPIVAGVARLAIEKYPGWGAATLRSELEAHARDLGSPGTDNVFGSGLVDAACVLQQVSPCFAGTRVSPLALTVTVTGPVDLGGGQVRHDGTVSGGLSPISAITWLRREGCDSYYYAVHVGASYTSEAPPPGAPYFIIATASSYGPEVASSAMKKVGTGFPVCP